MTIWTLIAEFFTIDPGIAAQAVEQTAFIPILISAVGAGMSLYAKKRAADQAADQAGAGNEMSEQARQDSMQRLSPEAMATAFSTFFPGLVQDQPAAREQRTTFKNEDTGGAATSQPSQRYPGQALSSDTQFRMGPTPGNIPGRTSTYLDDIGMVGEGGLEDRIAGSREQGGPMKEGESYLVGEGGPEVVTPTQDAQVTPNPNTQPPPPTAGSVGIGESGGGTTPNPEQPSQPTVPTPTGASETLNLSEPGAAPAANQLAMGNLLDMLANPGQFSTADYERRQEAASAGYQSRVQDITAQSMAGGIDPGSGVSQSMQRGAAMQEAKVKSEAARDQQLLEQQLRRTDIAAGQQMMMQMMNYILQLQGARSNAAGASFANPAVTATDNYSEGIGTAADIAIDAYNSSQANAGGGLDPEPGFSPQD